MTQPIDHLREICLALPEAHEKVFGGHTTPTFRVRDKIFANWSDYEDTDSVWCKAPPGAQSILVEADPARFFIPPYLGPKGWIGIRLDSHTDWEQVEELVCDSYRLIAPRRLAAQLDSAQTG